MVKISVVIVNYRVKYFLEQSLRSVRAALKAYPMEVEIFVVDNHSQDDSLDYLIPRFPEVRFIANTENVGFARANNQAIEQSTGKDSPLRGYRSARFSGSRHYSPIPAFSVVIT